MFNTHRCKERWKTCGSTHLGLDNDQLGSRNQSKRMADGGESNRRNERKKRRHGYMGSGGRHTCKHTHTQRKTITKKKGTGEDTHSRWESCFFHPFLPRHNKGECVRARFFVCVCLYFFRWRWRRMYTSPTIKKGSERQKPPKHRQVIRRDAYSRTANHDAGAYSMRQLQSKETTAQVL